MALSALGLTDEDWEDKGRLQEVSKEAAAALMQEEQALARQFLSQVASASASEGSEEAFVSTVTSADGSEMTVAVLKPSASGSSDSLRLSTGDSAQVSVPQAVLQQLGSDLVALTAGPLSAEMTKLLAAADTESEAVNLTTAPLSLSLFDGLGAPLSQQLAEPITLTLAGEGEAGDGGRVVCVFWDPVRLKWSREGLWREAGTAEGSIRCRTTHLSIFAAMRSVDLDFEGAFDCDRERERFAFSLAFGENSSWWRQGPATALWAGLVISVVASAVAASQDARSSRSSRSWVMESLEVLSEHPHSAPDPESGHGGGRSRRSGCCAAGPLCSAGSGSGSGSAVKAPLREQVMLYCFRCLQAFRVGVDIDTLGLSLELAQDQTDLEETPLRRAALDLAEQRDLCASATKAICSFTGAGLARRFLLLLQALHPSSGLLSSSLFYSRRSHVMLFSAKLIGPMALNVFLLQALGGALSYRSQHACAVQEALVKPLCAAALSCLLGQCVVVSLARLQRYDWSVKEADATYDEGRQVRWWRQRVRAYWIASLLYLTLSMLLIAAFLSSVSQADGTYWLYGALVNAVFQMVLLPVLNAFTLTVLCAARGGPKSKSKAELKAKVVELPDFPEPLPDGPGRPKAADPSHWHEPSLTRGSPFRHSGCVLEDYFTVTDSAPDSSRLGSLDLSPLRGAHGTFNETGFSFKPDNLDADKDPVIRPDTPRCFEATLMRGEEAHTTGGVGSFGRPRSPFQPVSAGLGGCQWREDADGLDFDLSHDLPGALLSEVFHTGRPTCAAPSDRGFDDSEALSELVLDMLDIPRERPPARQSSDLKRDEGLGTLRLNISADALGRTMTWSRKVEPSLLSIHESEDDWLQRPFQFSGEVFDEGDHDTHCSSPVKALTPESQADDSAFDAFPARMRTGVTGMDGGENAWAWVRHHVPDPYGTHSSASSAFSAAFDESPASPARASEDRRPFHARGE